MPDAGDHRHGAARDGARKALVVEGHEVFERASAANDEHHLDARLHHPAQALHDARRRLRALHRHARQNDAREREAASQRAQHVVHGIPARRGDQADSERVRRQRSLAARIHEPFGLEPARQLGHLLAQTPLPGKRQGEHVEVHAPLRRVQREAAGQLHKLSHAQRDAGRVEAVVPHHARQRRALVLHREVHGLVAGLVGHLGHLAHEAHDHALERALRERHRPRYRQRLGRRPFPLSARHG